MLATCLLVVSRLPVSAPAGAAAKLATRQHCVADIGTGESQIALAAAKRVAEVYTTGLDAEAFAKLEQLAAKEKDFIRL